MILIITNDMKMHKPIFCGQVQLDLSLNVIHIPPMSLIKGLTWIGGKGNNFCDIQYITKGQVRQFTKTNKSTEFEKRK
jgi:hypothetical protein